MNFGAIYGIARSRAVRRKPTTARGVGQFALLLVAFGAIAVTEPGRHSAAESTETIFAAVQPYVNNYTLAGAVMPVASRDRVVSLDAVGYMDIAAQKPMRTDALFWIASQSKPMTATALMMLVDESPQSRCSWSCRNARTASLWTPC